MMPPATGLDWAAWVLAIPLAGALLSVLWPRRAPVLGLITGVFTALAVAGALDAVWREGPIRGGLGGWQPPLGIALSLDGLSALMLAMTAVVGLVTSVYALGYLRHSPSRDHFWALWLWLWAALNALFLSGDAFNLYVTLEVVGLAAVALTALSGGAGALTAALRYLLVGLLGSLAYLLGVALLYGGYGVLDLAELGMAMRPDAASQLAAALITVGLLLKTALFPLHVWLPPAHSSAPAPVSAVLSALVVKAALYLLLRLWLEVFATLPTPGFAQFMGALGVGALLWGSVMALRAARLKQVVAYSTVAQLGYLFLGFPLLAGAPQVWPAVVFFALAHACAKATVFLAAGSLQQAAGHDRLAGLGPAMRTQRMTVFAFAMAGASLVGLPLTGGFVAKWLLVQVAVQAEAWALAWLILAGGLFAGGYVFRVLGHAFGRGSTNQALAPISAVLPWSALALALVSVALGFAGPAALELLARRGEWP